MQVAFTKYEALFGNDKCWTDVSEKVVMDRISDCYDMVSPVLLDLFQGKTIVTPDATIRIKK